MFVFFQSVVYEIPGINRCFLIEDKDEAVLKTEGVNVQVHPAVCRLTFASFDFACETDIAVWGNNRVFSEFLSQAAWKHEDILDLTKIYTNDIQAMANTYGIEAAGKVIRQVGFLARAHRCRKMEVQVH